MLELSIRGNGVGEGCWRIDELAQASGLTVDTIRYYVREKLLAPPERAGRHKLYGPDHLARIERIRDLQAQRFSLAAIRALLDTDRPGIERLLASDTGRQYTRDELIERAGVAAEVVDGLREVGLLPDPAEVGHEAYDESDLAALRAVAELQEIGMTHEIVIALGEIYVRHLRALQRDVHAMLAGQDRDGWDPVELEAIQRRLTANSERMIAAVDQVLNYVHQRMVQRLTLEAIQTAADTGTGVGGVKNT
jgi:DNA-binding transcriptional MerR regulator